MKTANLIAIVLLSVLSGCGTEEKTTAQAVSFGVYETVNAVDIPAKEIDTALISVLEPEKDVQLPVIGYILKSDSFDYQTDLAKSGMRLVKSFYTVDKEGKYCAVVAIKRSPFITITDVQKTKSKGRNVELYFTMAGARKWADLTEKNIGKTVAFVINDEVYTLPMINAKINSGVALINELENESLANEISISLNLAIPK